MSVLFGGFWLISGTYLGSYSSVWSVPNAGPYMILNSIFSLLGALLVGFHLRKANISGVFFLAIPMLLVLLDLFDILGRFQESQKENVSQTLTMLFFPPLYFHSYMIYLSAKIVHGKDGAPKLS